MGHNSNWRDLENVKDDPKMRLEKETVTNVKTNQKIYFPQREKKFLNFFQLTDAQNGLLFKTKSKFVWTLKRT